MEPKDITIPENWSPMIRKAMLYVFAKAHHVILGNWSECENSKSWDRQCAGHFDRSNTEDSQKDDIFRIIQARLGRVSPSKRPRYTSCERMNILEIKAAKGWNNKRTAEVFLVDGETIASWLKQLDEEEGFFCSDPTPCQ